MKKFLRIAAITILALAVVGMTACDFLFGLMVAPTLTVVDARTGTGLSGVAVTLTPVAVDEGATAVTVTGTSGSTGTVVFTAEVPYGTYTVTGTLTGYVLIPFETTIAGWSADLGTMYGVSSSKAGDTNAVSIFLTWAENSLDVDSYFTYPASFESQTAAAKSPWSADAAYYDLSTDAARDKVYFSAKNLSTDFASLDVDDLSGGGPETISLVGMNTGTVSSGSTISVSSSTPFLGSALAAGDYYWLGAGEYYIDSYSSSATLDSQSVRVVITQGSSIKGIFTLPTNTTLDTISLFRVHLLYNSAQTAYYMVFMPDMRLVDTTTNIKSIDSIPTDSVFVVSGSK